MGLYWGRHILQLDYVLGGSIKRPLITSSNHLKNRVIIYLMMSNNALVIQVGWSTSIPNNFNEYFNEKLENGFLVVFLVFVRNSCWVVWNFFALSRLWKCLLKYFPDFFWSTMPSMRRWCKLEIIFRKKVTSLKILHVWYLTRHKK